MATKPDLNKLKAEIDNRKRERNIGASPLGENIAPRDVFLFGLLESLQTGKETVSSSLVKTVDNKVAIKNKETQRLQVSEVAPVQQTQHIPMPSQKLNEVTMSPERDEMLFAEMERKRLQSKQQTLAESMGEYIAPTGAPARQAGQQMNLNEGYLVENVKKIVDNYLIDNFGPIVEEAIKSTILEMYAAERIKEVLQENKEMIKGVVIETIRDIQAKSKSKAQS